MFRGQTLFIVGAGASKEVDFPIGGELRERIVSLVDVHLENGSVVRGDADLYRQVQEAFSPRSNDCLLAGRRITSGIFGKRSIDEYLDWCASDRMAVGYGKAAIVRAILNEESRADKVYFGRGREFSLANFQNKWFHELFQMLIQGLRKEEVRKIFDNVKFLIFNYDRCLEYFLYLAMQRMDVPEEEARGIVSAEGTFYHAYGAVGPLFGQSAVTFGSREPHNFVSLSGNIRTFTEADSRQKSENPSGLISSAGNIVFLGFSFNDQNMQLLTPPQPPHTKKRIFGTTYGMSEPETQDIHIFLSDNPQYKCSHLDLSAATCAEFLRKYGSRISRQ